MRLAMLAPMIGLAACGDDEGKADTRDAVSETGDDSDSQDDSANTGDTTGDTGAASTYVLQGTAEGEDTAADRRAECHFGALVDQLVPDGDGGFSAFASGEVFRNVFPDTRRFEFSALVAGPTTLTAIGADTFALRFVGDQPDDALRFWLALEVIEGSPDGEGGWAGTWSCAPIDIDFGGFFDDGPTVEGTWTLVPQDGAIEPLGPP